MDRIRQLLARLADLSTDEMVELDRLIVEEFERIDTEAGDTIAPEQSAALDELAAAAEAVDNDNTRRTEEAATAAAQREAARNRLHTVHADPDEVDPAAPAAADPAAPAAADPAAPAAPAPAAVAADAGQHMARMSLFQSRRPQAVEHGVAGGRVAITAGGGLVGHNQGADITDPHEFARGMANTLTAMKPASLSAKDRQVVGRLGLFDEHLSPSDKRVLTTTARAQLRGIDRQRALTASVRWDYPDERVLGNDAWSNSEKIAKVVGRDAPRIAFGRSGFVASGGICAPVNVDYSVPTWSIADRPFRDGTPQFQATRGGIRYVGPPDVNDLASATSIWTEATDADPSGATKPVYVVACGTEEQVLVDAIPTRVQFGNMLGRFAPEQTAANTQLAVDYAARVAEINGLSKIDAGSIHVNATQLLGVARDLLYTLDMAAVAYRYRHRLADDQTVTVPLPMWTKALIRSDLLREQAHDNDSTFNVWTITDAQIEDFFTVRNINILWTLDGLAANTTAGGLFNYPTQSFGSQANLAALDAYPTTLAIPMYLEGMWQFLDSGALDLGVVRDSLLDATNDYETFIETFEGWAFRGFVGGSEIITLPINVADLGASIGTKAPA